MRFVILYRNRDDIKKVMAEQIVSLIKQGVKLNEVSTASPIFATRPFWPTTAEINSLPMYVQCEEVEWNGAKLILIHQLVIDIEVLNESESS